MLSNFLIFSSSPENNSTNEACVPVVPLHPKASLNQSHSKDPSNQDKIHVTKVLLSFQLLLAVLAGSE